jgi:peptidoglycan/LPS O-acetylase OafA/YrhL
MKNQKIYFKGLNALRFIAAGLVVLMHSKSNLASFNLPSFPDIGLFSKGITAVSFFFVLSGFLITYLLFSEHLTNKRVSVKAFYTRRVFRIWPLYFLIIVFGIGFYWFLIPFMGLDFEINYNKNLAVFLYLFFGANLMNSLFHVGGILHVTWSIAVEEQFYLVWAPIFSKFKKNIKSVLWLTFIFSSTVAILNKFNFFNLTEGWQIFIDTMQFHYMCIGGILAHSLFHNKEKLLSYLCFSSKKIQFLLSVLLVGYIVLYQKTDWAEPILIIPQGFLFVWLIINISSNPKSIFKMEGKIVNYLGKISYGIYMYHMIVVYILTFLCSNYLVPDNYPIVFLTIYIIVVFASTIGISILSYNIFEKKLIIKGSTVSNRITKSKLNKAL